MAVSLQPLHSPRRLVTRSRRYRPGMTTAGRAVVLEQFRWHEGHADVWRVFTGPGALHAVVEDLAAPWRDLGVTHVAGIESRGFLLGGAVAVALGSGFVAVRKKTGLLPGPTVQVRAGADYRGQRHLLRMQAVLGAGDRVVLVDDWAERGSQARAARALVEQCGATWLGVSLVVDQLTEQGRAALGPVTSLVSADELGPSTATPADPSPAGPGNGAEEPPTGCGALPPPVAGSRA